ncbi:dihydrofolate reductase family protein [Neorhizobium sp. BETTINA12A]|uniref:dihydrofolate reductase family protein n=1 Tax=Neorhizobium sp. BETTINA12A TaxID=2908924 RepID=UPI001FF55199|nr:dihydrofolate reductase family protein [Neorhizobium sp. BETTINA12A]MCJ9752813.1 dihydrofolate reductase family protein [Neorhizobium sp. BETTINA12A]
MAKLVFEMMISLDGYINDARGDFDWGHIDAEVHGHANGEGRRCGLAVYGRRMYETMAFWQTYRGDTPFEAEYAEIWRQTDKIVVSKTLTEPKTPRTKLVTSLDVDAMRDLKAQTGRDIFVSGPTLAADYLDAGLVDEIGIYYVPVAVGDGTPMFQTRNKVKLARTEEVPFANGTVFIRYDVLNGSNG